jgi:hypothetical protein
MSFYQLWWDVGIQGTDLELIISSLDLNKQANRVPIVLYSQMVLGFHLLFVVEDDTRTRFLLEFWC